MRKSSPSAPAAPDPAATAAAQAAANKEAVYESAKVNRINQYTPYGATKYRNVGAQVEKVGGTYKVGDRSFGDIASAQNYAASLPQQTYSVQRIQDNESGDRFTVNGRSFDTQESAQNYANTLSSTASIQQVGGGYRVGDKYYANLKDAEQAARDAEQWEQYVELTPEMQEIFNTQQDITKQLGLLAQGRAWQITTDPFTLEGLPTVQGDDAARQRIEQALYERQSALYEPQFAKQKTQLSERLAQQGIPVGSEAWQTAMDRLDREQNFQRQQTVGQSVAMGETAFSNQFAREQALRNQALSDRLLERTQPMNELSAFLQGSPAMSIPQLQQTPTYQVQPADVMGATYNSYNAQLNNYNQQMASRNATIGGLTSLAGTIGTGLLAFNPFGWGAAAGGAATGAAAGASMLSDRRAKENIIPVGKLDNGLTVYAFNYIGQDVTQIGLMADEVEKHNPDAVMTLENGLQAVKYHEAVK